MWLEPSHLSPASPQAGALQSPGAALEVARELASDGSVWSLAARRPPSATPDTAQDTGGERQGAAGRNSPFQPVDVGDGDHLEEAEDDEVQGSRVFVENLKPVAPRLQREAGGQQEADQAERPCGQTPRLSSWPWSPPSFPGLRSCPLSPPPPARCPGLASVDGE